MSYLWECCLFLLLLVFFFLCLQALDLRKHQSQRQKQRCTALIWTSLRPRSPVFSPNTVWKQVPRLVLRVLLKVMASCYFDISSWKHVVHQRKNRQGGMCRLQKRLKGNVFCRFAVCYVRHPLPGASFALTAANKLTKPILTQHALLLRWGKSINDVISADSSLKLHHLRSTWCTSSEAQLLQLHNS